MTADRLVDEYLRRLETAAAPLPSERRRDLVEEVRDHIETDLVREGRRDEAVVRNALERLGPPTSIVAAELDARKAHPDTALTIAAPGISNLGVTELVAVLLLTVGAVVAPLIGPAIGLVLTWSSSRWSRRTKAVITVVAIVLLVLPVALLLSVSSTLSP